MLEKFSSGRFLATVAVMGTLCAAVLMAVYFCLLNPDLYEKNKELVTALVVSFTGAVGMIINAYFNRSDRKTEPSKPQGGFVSMKMLIGLLTVLSLLWLAAPVRAEEGGAYFKVGSFELTYPISNASVISLYDFWKGEGLLGVETRLAKFQHLGLNGGAITSFQANGMPFVSLDFDWAGMIANISQTKFASVGIWYGHDFKANDNRAGIKASVPLW